MATKKIAVIVGSIRKGSYSKAVAKYVASIAPKDLSFEFVDIANLPLFNQDYDDENQVPASWVEFRKTIKDADGFLFVTPEHNRSFPAALKNALDIASRPYGQNVWGDKPGAIISVSPGAIAGFGANHQLRQVLVFLNVLTMAQPEAYIGHITASLNDKNEVANEGLQKFLKAYVDAFDAWVNRVSK